GQDLGTSGPHPGASALLPTGQNLRHLGSLCQSEAPASGPFLLALLQQHWRGGVRVPPRSSSTPAGSSDRHPRQFDNSPRRSAGGTPASASPSPYRALTVVCAA